MKAGGNSHSTREPLELVAVFTGGNPPPHHLLHVKMVPIQGSLIPINNEDSEIDEPNVETLVNTADIRVVDPM